MNANTPIVLTEHPNERRRRIAELVVLAQDLALREKNILALLDDEDYGVRRETAHAIHDLLAFDDAIPILLRGLSTGGVAQRTAIMDVFVRFGDRSVATLTRLLRDEGEGIRRLVVDALGLIATPSVTAPLECALRDAHSSVAAAAIEALARTTTRAHMRTIALSSLDESAHPFTALSALLACERLSIAIPVDVTLRWSTEPMTASVAMRMLGRAGAREPILAGLATSHGAMLRAALAGVAELLVVDPIPTRAALRARRLPVDEVASLVPTLERPALLGAVVLGAMSERMDIIEGALVRADVERSWSELERVMACFGGTSLGARLDDAAKAHEVAQTPAIKERLRALSQAVPAAVRRETRDATTRKVALSGSAFARLAALCRERAGLLIEESGHTRTEARLEPRVTALGLSSYDDYVALLDDPAHDDEWARALSLVTIHETYFFREPHQLDAFRRDVVPMLAERHAGDAPLSVWCAGCSTGEEAWSVAMILDEARVLRGRTHRVVGTDLSRVCIDEARAGIYGRRSLRGEIPSLLRARGLRAIGNDQVEVVPRLHSAVTFAVENLMAPHRPETPYDVVFCRNVLIYLTREARVRVIQSFFEALCPGGVLLLGHSESLLHIDTGFRFASLDRAIVYVKPLDDGTVPFGARHR
jgi:chemotaxis protein methyltransferase CheR